MKNKLTDLNDHLFEQLERLNDDDLTGDQLNAEIARSKAMTNVAQTIINNGELLLNAKKHADDYNLGKSEMPVMMQIDNK